MHLVAGNFIDLTTEKLLVPALPQLAVLAMIEVVGIQEDKVHVVGIGSKEVLALVIDRLESNPQFLEHRASSSRIVRVHVDCDEVDRSEEHTYELQSLMRISYAVFCL